MQESLLQFIWQYSLYSPQGLRTQAGESITVVHPGGLNRDAGPDFLKARIRIGDTTLVGHVELHVRSSDWMRHGHTTDEAYHNIILHVVYADDAPEAAGANVPVLALGQAIPGYVLDRYTHLLHTTHRIPCEHQHQQVSQLTKDAWLSRMLAERWETRLTDWERSLEQTQGDWRVLLFERLAVALGGKVNGEIFGMLARSLPLAILEKHRDNLHQVEALLFGQAGMLEDVFEESYPQALQAEYRFLQTKHSLVRLPAHLWKFMRMRPASFPTLRIAQLAALLHREPLLLSRLLEENAPSLQAVLGAAEASEYWQTHYRFGEPAAKSSRKTVGEDTARNILINAVAPIRFLYAHRQGGGNGAEEALTFLEGLPVEDNNIIREWVRVDWKPRNAADTQALLQLFNQYCSAKRCLECSVGLSIIRRRPVEC